MKKNLNEQVSRIKQMMGINEEVVNLNDYNDVSSIIEDIKRVGTTDDGNPITSMKVNTFIPNVGSETEGNKVKIEIILEWKPNDSTKFKSYRNNKRIYEYRVKSIVDIKSDVELDKALVATIQRIFVNHPTPYDLVNRIYAPYSNKFEDVSFDTLYDNVKKDREELQDVLSGEPSQQAEPEIQDAPEVPNEPEVAPEREVKKSNNQWTSTSSW